MIFQLKDTQKAVPLFQDWQETLIWSCLQNIMGGIYTVSVENPVSAMALLGDFCFLAGRPEPELVLNRPEGCKQDFIIMVPQNEQWAELIETCLGEASRKVTRYAIKKEPDIFDRDKLQSAVNMLPGGYILKMIDEDLFWHCKNISWCQDLVSQYGDYAMYQKHGLGAVILKDGELVSGASSYSGYAEGIEIEIDTREDYRRKGLAYICGAKLILECLKKGWYPSWDAQNKWSAALAEKLGYHFDHAYTAYEVIRRDTR